MRTMQWLLACDADVCRFDAALAGLGFYLWHHMINSPPLLTSNNACMCAYPWKRRERKDEGEMFLHLSAKLCSAYPHKIHFPSSNICLRVLGFCCLAAVPFCLPDSAWVISLPHTGDFKSAPLSWSLSLSHHVEESNCRWQCYGRQHRQQPSHELMLLKYAKSYLLCQHTIPWGQNRVKLVISEWLILRLQETK